MMGGGETLKQSGQLLALSAALHGVAVALSGFGAFGMILLVMAAVFLALSMGLARGMRRLGYVAFVVLLAGAVAAFAWVGIVAVPDIVLWAIVAVNLLAALSLFVALWRPRLA